jgi:hypothetical protein
MRRRCPECDQPVKEENLAAHMGKVHPRVSRRKYEDLEVPKPRGGRRRLPGWVPYAAILAAVTVGAALYFGSGPGAVFYAPHDTYDFGKVPQSTVEHAFPFENRGETPLRIYDVSFSCDCTSAHFLIGGVEGPHLEMHGTQAWEGTVAPGASGTLVAVYDATQMQDFYVGPREVYFRTNDGAHAMVTFTIWVDER